MLWDGWFDLGDCRHAISFEQGESLMRNLRIIAWNDTKLILKDKMAVFWMIVFPILFMFVFGSIFGGNGSDDPVKTKLHVVLLDEGSMGQIFVESIDTDHLDIRTHREEITEDIDSRILEIPLDFSYKLLNDPPVMLSLLTRESANDGDTAAVKAALYKTVIRLIGGLVQARLASVEHEDGLLITDRVATHIVSDRPVKIDVESAGELAQPPSGFSHSVPGNLVMFVLMVLLVNGGANLAQERKRGLFSRLCTTPTGMTLLVGGKLAGRMIPGIIQITILLGVGHYLFHVPMGQSPVGLVILVFAFSICAAALGILLGSMVKSEDHAASFGVMITLIMAALGGCWWPLEVVPRTLRMIGFCFPTGWAMLGFHKLFSFGLGLSDIWYIVLILLCYSALFMFFGTRNLKRLNSV
jgi:ABC-type multidrug transport system permease subunit